MKVTATLAILFFSSVLVSTADAAATKTCKKRAAAVQEDLDAVGALIDSGGSQFETKSDVPIEMVKEWLVDKYDADSAEEIELLEDSESFDDTQAGTTTAASGISSIVGIGETWYEDSGKDFLKKLEKAAGKLKRHRLAWGFDGTDQGWGGSPGSNVLLIDKKCKVVHSLFLGISHD